MEFSHRRASARATTRIGAAILTNKRPFTGTEESAQHGFHATTRLHVRRAMGANEFGLGAQGSQPLFRGLWLQRRGRVLLHTQDLGKKPQLQDRPCPFATDRAD